MSDAVQAAYIYGATLVIINVGTLAFQYLTHRKVKQLAHEMNSVRDKLVSTTGEKEYARGVKDQKESGI